MERLVKNLSPKQQSGFALKVIMIMPALLLRKPTFKSTAKEDSERLSRRLQKWEQGDLDALLGEASTIQAKLPTNAKGKSDERLSKTFAKLVLEGKLNALMKLLDQQISKGVLPLSQSTIDELIQKHPEVSKADSSLLMDGQPPLILLTL